MLRLASDASRSASSIGRSFALANAERHRALRPPSRSSRYFSRGVLARKAALPVLGKAAQASGRTRAGAKAKEVHWIGARCGFDLRHAYADQSKSAAIGGLIDQCRHVLPDHLGPLGGMRQAPTAAQDAEVRGLELEDNAAAGQPLAHELLRDAFAQPARDGSELRRRGRVMLQGGLSRDAFQRLMRRDRAVVVAVRIKRKPVAEFAEASGQR